MNKTNKGEPGKFIKFDDAYCWFCKVLDATGVEAEGQKIKFNRNGMIDNVSLKCAVFCFLTNKQHHIYMSQFLGL